MSPRHHRDRLDQLTDALERAGIHGRGGAGFPTATKLRAVAAQRGRPIIVVNAAEGEPLSQKDRYLLSARLGRVLDGALAAAQALDADEIVVAVDERLRAVADGVARAAAARPELTGGARAAVRTEVRLIRCGYVSGQETALIAALSGREAKPAMTPPYPFERGLRGRPTLVSNTETFAHIGAIASGSYDGTRLVTIGGAVRDPGLIEVRPDTTLAAAVQIAGGMTGAVRGVLLGGYGGTWAATSTALAATFDEAALRTNNLTLGPGIVFLLADSCCPVAEVARVAKWMAGQSAGQCGPCVNGLGAIAGALEELTWRGDRFATYKQIGRWSEMVTKRGACAHPDGVARFVTTALDVFRDEFEDHARHGGCEQCAASGVLPTPRYRRDPADSPAPRKSAGPRNSGGSRVRAPRTADARQGVLQ